MAKIWANRLIGGTQQFSDVPAFRVNAVKAELKTRVVSGEITADKYKEITGEDYTA